jgi:hypothetical protein
VGDAGRAWKGSDAGVDEVVPRLDLDGDGHLSHAEFRELWVDFWRGEDPATPGRWVFGAVLTACSARVTATRTAAAAPRPP